MKILLYLSPYLCCGKQYVGETTDEFRLRWNNYKSNDRKFVQNQACMQEHLFKHFNSNGHDGFLKNVSIILKDKTDGILFRLGTFEDKNFGHDYTIFVFV